MARKKKPTYDEVEKELHVLQEKVAARKLLDKHKKDLESQLQKNFAAGIAHDFNNLLMAIQANISLLLLDLDPTHPHYKRLSNIEEHIQSGARLTSRLLIQAKEDKFEILPLNLSQLVEETVESFQSVKKNIPIKLKFDKNLRLIKANSNQIEQLLFNLLVYSVDGISPSGNLSLATSNISSQKMQGKKYDPKPGNYVLLTVDAKGKDINKKAVERIFEPLLTALESNEPPDLSLASIYGTVKSYGGYIDIEETKGERTIFSVFLPGTNKKVTKLLETTEQFIKEKGTILLVDDEEAFLEVGQELLEALGYSVLVARNGKEALNIFKKDREKIGLILLDIIMPIMDGGETFTQLRKIDPSIKILLASGYSKDGTAQEILDQGGNGFIQKPFRMRELSKKITDIITESE